MAANRTTLEQWQALRALADHGTFSGAAEALDKSQSTVSYLIQKLQQGLGVTLVARSGRQTRITENGRIILDWGTRLLSEAREVEALAGQIAQGREPEVRLAIDEAFPTALLLKVMDRFQQQAKGTRIELHETILSGVTELLLDGSADNSVGLAPPSGYFSAPLLSVELSMVCASIHPLIGLGRTLTVADLEQHIQVVIRDAGPQNLTRGWLSRTGRWTVSSIHAAQTLILAGQCFGRLPRHAIEADLRAGRLVILPLTDGALYHEQLYLSRSPITGAGPAAAELVALLKDLA